MGFEVFSERLINARVNSNPQYVTIRAKLAINRLICNIVKLKKIGRLELRPWDGCIKWSSTQEKWVRDHSQYGYPLSLFIVGSCIRQADYAFTSRLGIKARASFRYGFAGDRSNPGTSAEATIFYNIGRAIYFKLKGLPAPASTLPKELKDYIDAQWNKLYVTTFGNTYH